MEGVVAFVDQEMLDLTRLPRYLAKHGVSDGGHEGHGPQTDEKSRMFLSISSGTHKECRSVM